MSTDKPVGTRPVCRFFSKVKFFYLFTWGSKLCLLYNFGIKSVSVEVTFTISIVVNQSLCQGCKEMCPHQMVLDISNNEA